MQSLTSKSNSTLGIFSEEFYFDPDVVKDVPALNWISRMPQRVKEAVFSFFLFVPCQCNQKVNKNKKPDEVKGLMNVDLFSECSLVSSYQHVTFWSFYFYIIISRQNSYVFLV